jgi:hypothetical protein
MSVTTNTPTTMLQKVPPAYLLDRQGKVSRAKVLEHYQTKA